MIYRIIASPPGYPPFLIGCYENIEFDSHIDSPEDEYENQFFDSIEAAREALPPNAKKTPSDPDAQFIELWSDEVD